MKTILKTLLIIAAVGTMVSCKSNFNAAETMEIQDNRNALYQEIISNPNQLTEFIDLAQQNEGAKKLMMKNHMQMMETGKMKTMMDKNPEMKEKMKSHMQNMMEENPEMKEKMQTKMLDKMLESPEGRKMLMQKMHENKVMQEEMKEKMMQKMKNNPAMMEEMMSKMKEKGMMNEKKDHDHKKN